VVHTAHQLGMALGLGVLVAVSAHAGNDLGGPAAVAKQADVALTGSSVLLAAALLVGLAVILPVHPQCTRPSGRPTGGCHGATRRERRVTTLDGSLTGAERSCTAASGRRPSACSPLPAPRPTDQMCPAGAGPLGWSCHFLRLRPAPKAAGGGPLEGRRELLQRRPDRPRHRQHRRDAGLVADLMDVDVYEIRAADPYPDEYEATVRRNVEE
jgi:hypothetical protein